METIMSEQTQLVASVQSEVANHDLITIDPLTYVTAVYATHHAALAAAKADIPATIDAATTAGYKLATAQRAAFKTIRVNAGHARQERKAPIIEIGKLIDSHFKALEAEITPFEDKFDALIKAEDARKEAIKAEKARIEAERVEAIQSRITAFSRFPLESVSKSAAEIQAVIESLSALEIDATFEEFTTAATSAKQDALAALSGSLEAAHDREAEQARLQAEREELERQRLLRVQEEAAAKVKREAEAAALAAERRALDAARAEQERAAKAQADAFAAQQAELMRQQEAIATQAEAARIAALPKPAPAIAEPVPAPVVEQVVKCAQEPVAPAQSNAVPEYLAVIIDLVDAIKDGSGIRQASAVSRAETFIDWFNNPAKAA